MRKVRKLLAVLVAVSIVASFAGCGGSASKSEATNATGTQQEASTGTSTSPQKEPVTLKCYFAAGIIPITPGIQDDPVAKEIEKQTGVTIDVMVGSADQAKVMVASGDLADISSFGDIATINSLIKAGSITPLDEYLTNASNIQKNGDKALRFSKEFISNGTGKTFALPERAKKIASPIATGQNGVFLRWDYYKELGTPEINNADDLIKVLADMQKKHPTNADGKKTYGVSTIADWGPSAAYSGISYLAKYSGLSGIQGFANFNIKSNEYVPLLDDKNTLWKGIEFYNKAYRAGILDPESFTQKTENWIGKNNEGRNLCVFAEWMIQAANADLAKSSNRSASYVDVPMLDTAEYTSVYDRMSPLGMTGRMLVVSSKCKAPQRAVDLFDYLFSEEGSRTILTGTKGRTWTEDGGKLKVTAEAVAGDADYRTKEAVHKYEGLVGLDYDALDSNGQFLDLFLEPDTASVSYTSAQKDYIQHYGASSLMDVIAKRTNKVTMNEAITALATPLTPDMNRIQSKITDYLSTNAPKLVMAKDDASFKAQKEKMFSDIKKMDYDKLNMFVQDGFKQAVEKAKSY
ncbi:MAG TPA: extracellular solute-binding protein [Ruminiclostridium sp.]